MPASGSSVQELVSSVFDTLRLYSVPSGFHQLAFVPIGSEVVFYARLVSEAFRLGFVIQLLDIDDQDPAVPKECLLNLSSSYSPLIVRMSIALRACQFCSPSGSYQLLVPQVYQAYLSRSSDDGLELRLALEKCFRLCFDVEQDCPSPRYTARSSLYAECVARDVSCFSPRSWDASVSLSVCFTQVAEDDCSLMLREVSDAVMSIALVRIEDRRYLTSLSLLLLLLKAYVDQRYLLFAAPVMRVGGYCLERHPGLLDIACEALAFDDFRKVMHLALDILPQADVSSSQRPEAQRLLFEILEQMLDHPLVLGLQDSSPQSMWLLDKLGASRDTSASPAETVLESIALLGV
ncbi:hypothetical protein GUITHDRAFT_104322 [Guillardia theta CCMP2712]|uniref:Uncharacterized protein n=1 Tax=Guillardia theta (strain CCMP2712) TaxID=905079 RepID=L1JMV8_GUITC|nr:hypothetical protein GUITHDRAFT_104322 [Guillardia theta CCMP2712]EKX49926.1 hypothetical protein GUITHDRAFT_104322 [Guillardia theta CCMP2712]|eukprot:XP_005836906.1 hypothetical protein GUITHDRAFT_104322 [Guillardia theta CCMP2712]